jgi:hypothetical protein
MGMQFLDTRPRVRKDHQASRIVFAGEDLEVFEPFEMHQVFEKMNKMLRSIPIIEKDDMGSFSLLFQGESQGDAMGEVLGDQRITQGGVNALKFAIKCSAVVGDALDDMGAFDVVVVGALRQGAYRLSEGV